MLGGSPAGAGRSAFTPKCGMGGTGGALPADCCITARAISFGVRYPAVVLGTLEPGGGGDMVLIGSAAIAALAMSFGLR